MADETRPSPGDRRRRREARFPAKNLTGSAGGVPIRVRDVSLGGIGARCDQALKAGKTHNVVIRGESASVELQAEARWCRMSVGKEPAGGESVAYYGIGFRIVALSDEQRRVLEACLGRSLDPEPDPG